MQKPPAYVLRLATGCEERAHSYRTQNTVTSSSAERSLLKAETEYMEGPRAAGRRPFMPDSALNRRSEALSGWKHNKCPLLPLNYPENPFYDKRFLQQCPRADIRKVPLDSNYARANYSDAEINAEILRRFRASQGNVEKDK